MSVFGAEPISLTKMHELSSTRRFNHFNMFDGIRLHWPGLVFNRVRAAGRLPPLGIDVEPTSPAASFAKFLDVDPVPGTDKQR